SQSNIAYLIVYALHRQDKLSLRSLPHVVKPQQKQQRQDVHYRAHLSELAAENLEQRERGEAEGEAICDAERQRDHHHRQERWYRDREVRPIDLTYRRRHEAAHHYESGRCCSRR